VAEEYAGPDDGGAGAALVSGAKQREHVAALGSF